MRLRFYPEADISGEVRGLLWVEGFVCFVGAVGLDGFIEGNENGDLAVLGLNCSSSDLKAQFRFGDRPDALRWWSARWVELRECKALT